MNEATADNNGAYLSDGRHGNGCRQKESERWGERERDCSCAQCWIVPPRFVLPLPPQLALVKRYQPFCPHVIRNLLRGKSQVPRSNETDAGKLGRARRQLLRRGGRGRSALKSSAGQNTAGMLELHIHPVSLVMSLADKKNKQTHTHAGENIKNTVMFL